MPETMKAADERRLYNALADVAGAVNDGSTPDQAIEKAARDHSVPCGHVRLMVAAYNTGRTTRQREDGTTTSEKAADFPLANTANILERLYPSEVKSASVLAREGAVSAEYFMPPVWYTRPIEKEGMGLLLTKTAEAASPKIDRWSDEWQARRYQGECDRADHAVREERLALTRLQTGVLTKFAALADYFDQAGHLSVADVRDSVHVLHGAAGDRVLDRVTSLRPRLTKAACRNRCHPVDETIAPYSLIRDIITDAELFVAVKAANERRVRIAATIRQGAQFMLTPAEPKIASVLDEPRQKQANPIMGGVGYAAGSKAIEAVGAGLEPPDNSRQVAKAMRQIATPEHEQELAAIEARAQLSQMLNHDSILKGHHPRDVAHHYNQISQFAPEVARKPLMTVPLLRRSVQQGQLDTFDAKEVADTENKLVMRNRPPGSPQEGQKHASASVLDW